MCALVGSVLIQNGYDCKLIYTVHDQPGQIGMIDRETERSMRMEAFAHWNQ